MYTEHVYMYYLPKISVVTIQSFIIPDKNVCSKSAGA